MTAAAFTLGCVVAFCAGWLVRDLLAMRPRRGGDVDLVGARPRRRPPSVFDRCWETQAADPPTEDVRPLGAVIPLGAFRDRGGDS